MHGKEAVQGGAGDVFAPPQNIGHQVPNKRKGLGDGRHHRGGPETELAPGQEIATQAKAEGGQEQ